MTIVILISKSFNEEFIICNILITFIKPDRFLKSVGFANR
jgi:hypothetical protein